jgi:mono/diheme cytochrome c family protein
MNKILFILPAATLIAAVLLLQPSHAASPTGEDARADAHAALVARGDYIVNSFGCADCHTPKKFGPNGPELIRERAFSGHMETDVLPPAPALPPGPWIATVSGDMTAWSGPWGTSFTANLTPDPETGLGKWTEETFLSTVRSGRHMGRGREILPPMPIEQLNHMTDDDLRAIFAYLQSLPAVKNRVPAPLPPAGAR